MIATLSRYSRQFLGATALAPVIAIVVMSGLPEWAQAVVLSVVALAVLVWTRLPDTDGDGIPDQVEIHAPTLTRLLEQAHASELDARALVALERIAAAMVRRHVGVDHDARSPALVAVVALMLALMMGCGSTLYLATDGAATVAAGIEGLPPLEVESDGAAVVVWQVGSETATVTATAGACVRVTWAGLTLAETCTSTEDTSPAEP